MSPSNRCIMHIDCNSAFLAFSAAHRLQQGDSLDLRTIPSAVGGNPETRHGIILAKSIPCKAFNIQTGETLHAAFQKCPTLVIVPPDYPLYVKCSNAMMEIIKDFSPAYQKFSIDEIFLDYTNMQKHFGHPVDAAHKIKDRIKNELGFTVSIGISSNKLLAKMASDLKKPDAVTTLYPEEMAQKMWPLDIQDLFMIGPCTAPKLRAMGINTIGELAAADLNLIRYRLKSHGELIYNYAHGIEASLVHTGKHIDMKGIGNSSVIPFDVDDRLTAHQILLSLTETVAMRLRDAACVARLISVSVRDTNFRTYSHQRKIFSATDSTNEIYRIARDLFDEAWQGEALRHFGVRVSELCSNEFQQTSFFDDVHKEKNQALDRAIDSLRFRFGSTSVHRAGFLNSGIKPLMGGIGSTDEMSVMTSIL
ncbi:DNA polymerase Y family protein [Geosporobacter ferrireducens]|uniref:DNA polymerase IV n=1 Tax=Geosporobacter ferrireducens TaxID=1424294 RepID=A0A1D8GBN4_9FIRM|nr:DNA polymerase IV [Geosporobacter ferrireducens]AOT68314.1 DNA polymerase IV [Geosporobacter ferrireducens]